MTDHALDLYGDAAATIWVAPCRLENVVVPIWFPICRVTVGWLNEHAN
jgi:hypothetical protein